MPLSSRNARRREPVRHLAQPGQPRPGLHVRHPGRARGGQVAPDQLVQPGSRVGRGPEPGRRGGVDGRPRVVAPDAPRHLDQRPHGPHRHWPGPPPPARASGRAAGCPGRRGCAARPPPAPGPPRRPRPDPRSASRRVASTDRCAGRVGQLRPRATSRSTAATAVRLRRDGSNWRSSSPRFRARRLRTGGVPRRSGAAVKGGRSPAGDSAGRSGADLRPLRCRPARGRAPRPAWPGARSRCAPRGGRRVRRRRSGCPPG